MHPIAELHNIAQRQGGVVRRSQALAVGVSDRQIATRLTTRGWDQVTKGAYRVFDMPGKLNVVRAAVAALPDAVVSHSSAAAIHGFSYLDTSTASVLVHSRTTHTFPGVRVFRCFDLARHHVVWLDGLPVTSIPRTVVDLAAQLHPRQLGLVIDDVLAAGEVAIVDVADVLRDVARKGKPGVRSLRKVLDERCGEPRPGSVLEIHGNRLLIKAGLGDFVTEHKIPWSPSKRFDVAYVDDTVAIEWDSRRWHLQATAFESDRFRDIQAARHGWTVLRFTWADVHDRPGYVIESVRSILRR